MAAYQHETRPTQVQPLRRLAICIPVSPSPGSVRNGHKDLYENFVGEFVDEERAVPEVFQFQTSTKYWFHDDLLFRIQFCEFLTYRFA